MKNIIRNFRGLVAEAEYWSSFEDPAPSGSRWLDVRHWFDIRAYAAWTMIRDAYARAYCSRFGHDVVVEDFVAAERDDRGRIVDIDGGGVDWYCIRCRMGGRNWF